MTAITMARYTLAFDTPFLLSVYIMTIYRHWIVFYLFTITDKYISILSPSLLCPQFPFNFLFTFTMEFQRPLCLFLFLFITLISTSQANNFSVRWTPNPSENYNQWSGRNRFQVNDTIGNSLICFIFVELILSNCFNKFDFKKIEFNKIISAF